MLHAVYDDLSASNNQAPPIYGIVAASIAPGSTLHACTIDDRVLGVGGIVACGPGSTISAKQIGLLTDEQNSYVDIRITPVGGYPYVEQVADKLELIFWTTSDKSWVPCTRRANQRATAFVPFADIPVDPFEVGLGRRALRMACPGREKAHVWLTAPALNPGATISLLWRTRTYGIQDTGNIVGAVHGCWEEIYTPPGSPVNSYLTADGPIRKPLTIDLQGAAEIELYLALNDSSDDGWWVSCEVVDP